MNNALKIILFTISAVLSGCCFCAPPIQYLPGHRPPVLDYTTDCNCVLDFDNGCPYDDGPATAPCRIDVIPLDPDPPLDQEYVFDVGDSIDISVFGDEETAVENVAVAPDGNIYYLFLNATPAAGMTITELSNAIASQLNEYYVDPLVSIVPKTAVNRTYRILGRVYKPGVYYLVEPKRIRDALAEAGGIITTYYEDSLRSDIFNLADLTASFLIRDGRKMNVDFESLVFSADDTNNVPLMPNDYIYIAPAEHKYVYVLGNVLTPHRIVYAKGMTVMGALALAGGWTIGTPYAADPSKLLIIRGALECPCVIRVDLNYITSGMARDVFLQPGDIVFAQNKTVRFGRELVRLAIATFLQSFASSAGSYWSNFEWFD